MGGRKIGKIIHRGIIGEDKQGRVKFVRKRVLTRQRDGG